MKYKQMCLNLKNEIETLEWKLDQAQTDKFKAQNELLGLKEFVQKLEGRESDIRRENEWLKTTLRMVIVSDEKIKILAEFEQLGQD